MIPLNSSTGDPNVQAAVNYWNTVCGEYQRLQNILNRGTQLIWNNPNGLTPQESINLYGPNGVALVQLSGLLCGLLGAIGSTTPNPVPAGWALAPNADGTVTITGPSTGL